MTEIPVEDVKAGTRIVLPNGKARTVTAVERYDDGSYVVVYADSTLHAWENRATDKGRWSQRTIEGLEKTLRVMRKGDRVRVKA